MLSTSGCQLKKKEKRKNRRHVLSNERMHHDNDLGKGIEPECDLASGPSWQFTGNAENKEVW